MLIFHIQKKQEKLHLVGQIQQTKTLQEQKLFMVKQVAKKQKH